MFTFAIVDDEKAEIESFKNLFARFFSENPQFGSDYKTVEFTSGEQFMQDYMPNYDVIFLDIDMKGINGVETAKRIREVDDSTVIVFITRMARYAIDGYSVAAFDFIVKPLDYASFSVRMKRVLGHVQAGRARVITLNASGEVYIVNVNDIIYLEVQNHFVIWHTKQGNISIWGSLKDAIDQIGDYGFGSCNRCYYVNLRYVQGVGKDTVRVCGENLLISRYRRKEFLESLAKFYGKDGGA